MNLLITNDDGIDAPGLEALLTAARTLGDPIVVAPAAPQSGVSHAVTWHEGVRIESRGEKRFAIHGTPADCIRLGLLHLVPDANWVVSGSQSWRESRRGCLLLRHGRRRARSHPAR